MLNAVRLIPCILMACVLPVAARAETAPSSGVTGSELPWEVVLLMGLLGGLVIAFAILAWHQLRRVTSDEDFDVPLHIEDAPGDASDVAQSLGSASSSAVARSRTSRPPVNGARMSFGKRA